MTESGLEPKESKSEREEEDASLDELSNQCENIPNGGSLGIGSEARNLMHVIQALKINGKLTVKLIKSNEQLVESNARILGSMSTAERFSRGALKLAFALLFLALLQLVGSYPSSEGTFFQFLPRLIAVVSLVVLVFIFATVAWVETLGRRRAKRSRKE